LALVDIRNTYGWTDKKFDDLWLEYNKSF